MGLCTVVRRWGAEREDGWRGAVLYGPAGALCMFDDDKERLRRLTDKHINDQVSQTVRYCVVGSGLRHQLITGYRST